MKAVCKSVSKSYYLIAYSDVTALFAPSMTELQLFLDNVPDFPAEISLCLNDEKSIYIVFRSKTSKVLSTLD